MTRTSADRTARQGISISLVEAVVIWMVIGMLIVAIFVTYARLPASELYHVSTSGIAGGASRALVYLNFPVGFLAIALLGFAVARICESGPTLSSELRIGLGGVSALSVALCLVAAVPGVVDQGDLDARPINAIPAIGVVLALVVSVIAIRRAGLGTLGRVGQLDLARFIVIDLVGILVLPWILADIGVYISDMPVISKWFMSEEVLPGETLKAVHLGHHHGLDGALLLVSGLVLTRSRAAIQMDWLRVSLTLYLSFMTVYGLGNMIQDFRGEQVIKRGWSDTYVPAMLRPALTPVWALLLLVTGMVFVVVTRFARSSQGTDINQGTTS